MAADQRNKIGVLHGVSFVCSNIVGVGLFLTPSSIVRDVQSVGLAMVVWVVSALISFLGACCYMELGTSIRKSGSDVVYLCAVEWYSLAFSCLTTYSCVVLPGLLAVLGQTFAEYFFVALKLDFHDHALNFWGKSGVGFALIFFLMVINLFSIKTIVARFQLVATAAKIGSTLTICAIGGYYLLWRAEDVANPRRTMPLAVSIGMAIVTLLFVATNFSFFVVLSVDEMLNSEAVATTFAEKTMGSVQHLMPFMICVLLVGSCNSMIFMGSRFFYAGARQGQLPSFLSITNGRHESPRPAVFFHCLAACFLWFVGDVNSMIVGLSYTIWIQRAMSIVVILYIRFKKIPVHPDPVRMPLVMHVSFFLIISTLVAVSAAQNPKGAAIGVGSLLVCFVLYLILMHPNTLSRFEGYRRFCKTLDGRLTAINETLFNGKADGADSKAADDDEKDEQKDVTVCPSLHSKLTKSNSSLQLLDHSHLKSGDLEEAPKRASMAAENERF